MLKQTLYLVLNYLVLQMSFKVVSRLKEELDDHSGKGDAKRSSGHYSVVHSHEDLVSGS